MRQHDYGIKITPASRQKLFQAVIVGAVATLVLFGLYMTGEYLVDMHRDNRILLRTRNTLIDRIQFLDAKIAELESQNAALLDDRDRYESRLSLFHLDGEINAPIVYEPGDDRAAQSLYQEARDE